jgi:penicillin-binding protein 1A
VQHGRRRGQRPGASSRGALVVPRRRGRIRAYVGGRNYLQSQFDRATQAAAPGRLGLQALRLPRPRWRPAARPSTPVVDEPIKIGNWEPRNYTGQYLGPITIGKALEQSINTVAARLANEVGTSNVAATARRLGITSPIQLDPSMALGAVEVSPLEMAQAYAPFSNGGVFAKAMASSGSAPTSGRVLYDTASPAARASR